MSDQQLIQLYLSGNQQAFSTLVRNHQQSLFNFVRRFINDYDDASDLCQRVFIKCFQGLKDLKDQQKFKSWLFTIARNQINDHWRAQSPHTVRIRSDELGPLPDLGSTPDQAYDQEIRLRLIQEALNRLPEEQKEVLILKILSGMKFTEIAKITNSSPNTVKSRCYYGLSALRKIFKTWKIQEL